LIPKGFRCGAKHYAICLLHIDSAARLESLRAPPGNGLERLKGDRASQWGIRTNEQWRICFRWQDGQAWDVEIVDYH
jgi:proteic killer suppression protein